MTVATVNQTLSQFVPLLPVFVVILTAIVVMLGVAFKRSHLLSAIITTTGLNIALGLLLLTLYQGMQGQNIASSLVTTMFVVDGYAVVLMSMIVITALACATLLHAYLTEFDDIKEEIYMLLLFAVAGAMLLTAARNFASFFIALELMGVSSVAMIAYTFKRHVSLEAGIKYLVLSATASATLLMGMALIYAASGRLDFIEIAQVTRSFSNHPILALGAVLLFVAVGFKLSLAPLHQWTADVYQGAPAPITLFMSTISKLAVFAVFFRVLLTAVPYTMEYMSTVLTVAAVLSVVVGNLLAVVQVNLKRLLAFSSIAHMGYILLAILAMGGQSTYYVVMYLLVYALTSIGAIGVISLMSSPYSKHTEAETLADYRGLFWRHPVLASVMTVMMLSLAGIPLTAGFIAKFFVMLAIVQAHSWWLAALLIVGSAIGLYYYLRVIVVMFMTPPPQAHHISQLPHWGVKAAGVMVLLVTLAVLFVGVYPSPLMDVVTLAYIGG